MKYIFLDIDGVLNSKKTKIKGPYNVSGIEKKHLLALKQIVNETGAKIVLISDWRLSFLPDDHMPDMAIYIEEKLKAVGLEFELVSDIHRYEDRVAEIKQWLQKHKTEGYIILDDENHNYDVENIKPHWIHTNYKEGLLDKHVAEAVEKMSVSVKTEKERCKK